MGIEIPVEPEKDIDSMTLDELKEYRNYCENKQKYHDSMQMAYKIMINSLYGAAGTNIFRYYDLRIAASITAMGRMVIRSSERAMSKYINSLVGGNRESYAVAGDTDSAVGSTVVAINNEKMTFDQLWNRLPNNFAKYYPDSGQYVKQVSGVTTKTVVKEPDKYKVVDTPIVYAMKHKVNKEMYRVTVDGKSMEITGDHSIMIERDGELIKGSIHDLKKGDRIVYVNS